MFESLLSPRRILFEDLIYSSGEPPGIPLGFRTDRLRRNALKNELVPARIDHIQSQRALQQRLGYGRRNRAAPSPTPTPTVGVSDILLLLPHAHLETDQQITALLDAADMPGR